MPENKIMLQGTAFARSCKVRTLYLPLANIRVLFSICKTMYFLSCVCEICFIYFQSQYCNIVVSSVQVNCHFTVKKCPNLQKLHSRPDFAGEEDMNHSTSLCCSFVSRRVDLYYMYPDFRALWEHFGFCLL